MSCRDPYCQERELALLKGGLGGALARFVEVYLDPPQVVQAEKKGVSGSVR